VLRDGSIAATIFNRPSHGQMEGDAECWTSANGEFWTKAGTVTQHEPNTVRMNVASGLAKNGDLLVLCSGWTDLKQPERPKQPVFRDDIISTWVCRSRDGGRTWSAPEEMPIGVSSAIRLNSGKLGGQSGMTFYVSQDDGNTWEQRGDIAASADTSWIGRGVPNFDVLMQGNPQIALTLLKLFTNRIHDQKRKFMILTLDDVEAKVADVFLMLAENEPVNTVSPAMAGRSWT
jgi:hypothetical protein